MMTQQEKDETFQAYVDYAIRIYSDMIPYDDPEYEDKILQLGVDLTKVSLNPYYELWLDLDKILAIGEIENIPGMDNMKGFSVWFNNEANNCWYLDQDSYDMVISNIPK